LVFCVLVRQTNPSTPVTQGRQKTKGWIAMIELVVVSIIALLVLGIAFYQSHQDKQRWKRATQRRKKPSVK